MCTFMTLSQFVDPYASERKIVEKNGLYSKYDEAYAAAQAAGLTEAEITVVSIF